MREAAGRHVHGCFFFFLSLCVAVLLCFLYNEFKKPPLPLNKKRNDCSCARNYAWMGLSYVAMHASLTASESVGWAWHVRAMSSELAPYSMASTPSAMSSPALLATMCMPRILSVVLSASTCRRQ